MVLIGIAALALLDAVLVTASLFMTDRAPVSAPYFHVSYAISAYFGALAGLAFGIQRQLGRVGVVGAGLRGAQREAFDRALGPLVGLLLLASLLFGLLLAFASYAILARIDQDFAVFG